MTHDEITKQGNEEPKEPVTSGSLSDADLEQVAGGYSAYDNFGTRTGPPIMFKPRR